MSSSTPPTIPPQSTPQFPFNPPSSSIPPSTPTPFTPLQQHTIDNIQSQPKSLLASTTATPSPLTQPAHFQLHSPFPTPQSPPPATLDPLAQQTPPDNSWRQRYLPFFYNPQWTPRTYIGENSWDVAKPYVIGCGAAMYTQCLAIPFQNIKVFQQALDRSEYKNAGKIRNLFNYFRTFGLFNLWRGCPTAFQGQFVSTFAHLHFLRHTHDEPTPLGYADALATSFLAVTIASIAFAPFDLITTRQQADPLLPHQLQRQYRSLYSAIPRILANEGVTGLYRGAGLSLTRNLAHSATLLSLFPFLTGLFQQRNTAVDSFCYVALATASAILLHPLDTMKVIRQITPPVQIDPHTQKIDMTTVPKIGPIRAHLHRNGFFSLYRGIVMNSYVTVGFPIATYLIVDLVARSKLVK